jgi:hypothetical protein
MDDPQKINVGAVVVHWLVALCGGVVREITSGKHISFVRFLAGGSVGAFTGMLVFCVCKHYGLGEWLTAAATGMGGYTGAPLLDLGSNLFRKIVERNLK